MPQFAAVIERLEPPAISALMRVTLARVTDRQEAFVLTNTALLILLSGGGGHGADTLDPIANGWLAEENGRLRAAAAEQQPALDGALHAVLADPAGTRRPFVLPRSGKPPLLCSATAFGLHGERFVLVRVVAPEAQRALSAHDLDAWFSLTPAERELALDLLGGDALAESADRRDRKVLTARTQLKRVFDKTGANRQALLMRLLTRLTQI